MKNICYLLSLLLALPVLAGKPQQLNSPDHVPEGLAKSDWQSIRAAHEGWKHQFQAVEGGWQATNDGQQWTTRFDGRGFVTKPKDADWTWGLAFQSYGFGDHQIDIDSSPDVRAEGQRLTYEWSDVVEEWFVNDARGLEHGFTISERPIGGRETEELGFTLATQGALKPKLAADGQTVHFRDEKGATILNYSGLKVWDADGVVLPSRFEVTGGEICLLVEETTARYPLTIDPLAQQAYLKASNTGASDQFGISVAVYQDTVVVGAYGENSSTSGVNSVPDDTAQSSGAAYVFVRNGGTWTQQAYLKASNPGGLLSMANQLFGCSVAVYQDTVVVGAYFENSNSIGVPSTPNDNGAANGAAYVFVRNNGVWSEEAYLKASNSGRNDYFGWDVAVYGDTVVVGAHGEDSSTMGVNTVPDEDATASGAVYVFTRSAGVWSEQAYLKASNAERSDNFGFSVAAYLDTVVVGAPFEGGAGNGLPGSGAVYVFVRNSGVWSEQAYLKASNAGANDYFGIPVALSGDTVVVGADREDGVGNGVPDSGAAYVFVRNSGTWIQQAYLNASNPGPDDRFGCSVAVDGNTVVVGASGEDSSTRGVNSTPDDNAAAAGAAYVFVRSGTIWSQQSYLKACNAGAADIFGFSVAVSGDTVVVGAPGEDSSMTGVNSTPNEAAQLSGAAYIFAGRGFEDYVSAAGLTGNDALAAATPFNDGVPNLLKYAFNMNAAGSDVGTLVPTTGTAGTPVVSHIPAPSPVFRFEFIRRKLCGLNYTPLESATLAVGSWQPATGTTTVTSIDPEWDRVVIEQPPSPGPEPKMFYRVEVEIE